MATQTIHTEDQIKKNMDNMYRWTRHIYDLTRKYYLLGRDKLIQELDAKTGQYICEVGCGTARNLIKMADRYPAANFLGLDASDEMLKTANVNLKRAEKESRITVKQAYSQSFDPKTLFNLGHSLDKIVFSYALSIIPPWQESIDHALTLLPTNGEIHIVDFSGQEDLPSWFRSFLFWWLRMFHVYHKPEILNYLKKMESDGKGKIQITPLYRGYAYHAIFKKA